ncbi:MAG TPA: carboxymuconolactone decarboxylase family protein [Oligoflexia bacterium]|nr:carboxymuconolactone decarboxylase family protein [Oligoflexia bacterium]
MSISLLRDSLKDYARDIKLNLGSVLTEEGAPGLTKSQILGTALSCAYATKNSKVIEALEGDVRSVVAPETLESAKAATTIMAMNNVYYRTVHLSEDKDLRSLPARLRMNVIGKPGIAKVDFELMCLAVSAMSGCGACINSHISEVKKAGISTEGAQSAIRIASVINALAQAATIG